MGNNIRTTSELPGEETRGKKGIRVEGFRGRSSRKVVLKVT